MTEPSLSPSFFDNPCDLVRMTCQKWVDDHKNGDDSNAFVVIHDAKISDLADEILSQRREQQQEQHQQQQQQQQQQREKQNGPDQSSSSPTPTMTTTTTAAWIEWDEEEWHYTGKQYQGSETDRKERVALYLLALDAINFCFWPCTDLNADKPVQIKKNVNKTNPLEYEHLAMALKRLAEMDDDSPPSTSSSSSFALSPQKLADMTDSRLQNLIQPHFDSLNAQVTAKNDVDQPSYSLPNLSQRSRLWNEVGRVLLDRYQGSATKLIECADGDASRLVKEIVTAFPGFHDLTIFEDGINVVVVVVFLKRAQILVGDLNAALHLNLTGMDRLTTFADYRVPQILRHKGILEYESGLADRVDQMVELDQGSVEEVSIRAATVVAVQNLVRALNAKSSQNDSTDKDASHFTDVTVDWYLWQVGEKMNNDGLMKPFHRVRTQFY